MYLAVPFYTVYHIYTQVFLRLYILTNSQWCETNIANQKLFMHFQIMSEVLRFSFLVYKFLLICAISSALRL